MAVAVAITSLHHRSDCELFWSSGLRDIALRNHGIADCDAAVGALVRVLKLDNLRFRMYETECGSRGNFQGLGSSLEALSLWWVVFSEILVVRVCLALLILDTGCVELGNFDECM